MSMFLTDLMTLIPDRPDGVHIYPIELLDSPYAIDNGSAFYVYLPATPAEAERDLLIELLDRIPVVKVNSPAHDRESGYALFHACRLHTTRAHAFLDSTFAFIINATALGE